MIKRSITIDGIVSNDIAMRISDGLKRRCKNNNTIIVFCSYSEFEIPIGTIFKHVIDLESKISYSKKITLVDVTQEFSLPYDSIPKGHKTICKLEFEIETPEVIRRLPVIDSWFESNKRLLLSE